MNKVLLTSAIALTTACVATATLANVNMQGVGMSSKAGHFTVAATGGMNIMGGNFGPVDPKTDKPNTDTIWESKDLAAGYNLGATVGYYMTDHVSLEGAFSYVHNGASDKTDKDNNLSQLLFMTNLKYNFNFGDFSPFVGAGIGLADMYNSYQPKSGTSSRHSDYKNTRSFAYQAIVGLNYNLNSSLALGVNYHLLSSVVSVTDNRSGDAKFKNATPFINMINAGVTYTF